MILYSVFRCHCKPGLVLVLANTAKEAKKLTNKEFGFSETVIKEVKNGEPRVLFPNIGGFLNA